MSFLLGLLTTLYVGSDVTDGPTCSRSRKKFIASASCPRDVSGLWACQHCGAFNIALFGDLRCAVCNAEMPHDEQAKVAKKIPVRVKCSGRGGVHGVIKQSMLTVEAAEVVNTILRGEGTESKIEVPVYLTTDNKATNFEARRIVIGSQTEHTIRSSPRLSPTDVALELRDMINKRPMPSFAAALLLQNANLFPSLYTVTAGNDLAREQEAIDFFSDRYAAGDQLAQQPIPEVTTEKAVLTMLAENRPVLHLDPSNMAPETHLDLPAGVSVHRLPTKIDSKAFIVAMDHSMRTKRGEERSVNWAAFHFREADNSDHPHVLKAWGYRVVDKSNNTLNGGLSLGAGGVGQSTSFPWLTNPAHQDETLAIREDVVRPVYEWLKQTMRDDAGWKELFEMTDHPAFEFLSKDPKGKSRSKPWVGLKWTIGYCHPTATHIDGNRGPTAVVQFAEDKEGVDVGGEHAFFDADGRWCCVVGAAGGIALMGPYERIIHSNAHTREGVRAILTFYMPADVWDKLVVIRDTWDKFGDVEKAREWLGKEMRKNLGC